MKVVTANEMRAIERDAVDRGIPLGALMRRAGQAVARAVKERADGGHTLILTGPGNNGGDGLVAAEQLRQEGHRVAVYTLRRESVGDFGGKASAAESDESRTTLISLVRDSGVIVDALLGIGQSRPPEGALASILETVDEHRPPRSHAIAVDIPTGVNADTGAVPGVAFRATVTLAMGFVKCGSVLFPGAEYSGQVHLIDVGIPPELGQTLETSVPDDAEIARLLPTRGATANKGTSGRLVIVAGSCDFLGAPALASLAAYRAGAGLVEVATPRCAQASVAAHALEPVYNPLPEADGRIAIEAVPQILRSVERARALVCGPGMGISDATVQVMGEIMQGLAGTEIHGAVIDADGLNALAQRAGWWERPVNLILTPHPGEMARLTGLSIPAIQSDRLATARRFAAEWAQVVVLKGAGTVVASPLGEAVINPTGGPNLATAGTGDVLSGIIGGLLAQGCRPFDAAVAGTYWHGRAGDLLRAEQGDVGTLASDLLSTLPAARLSILRGGKETG